MGHRNMRYNGPIVDMEIDQQAQGDFTPYTSISNFQQPNYNAVLPAPGNGTNFDVQYLPEPHAASSYGMTQYNGVQHQYPAGNIDLAASTTSNHYNMYMTPSSTRGFPVPINTGQYEQFPSSGNHGIEFPADNYSRNTHFIDGLGGSFKRKNAEFLSRNIQYHYASPGSSSLVAPMSGRPIESDVGSVEVQSFPVPDSRGTDMSSVMDNGSHRSMRNISGATGVDSLVPHNANHIIRGQYPGQPFQTAGVPWMDHQFNSNAVDFGPLTWNQPHALPYVPGNFNGGCMEPANMGLQEYQFTASNRTSAAFLPPPPILPGHFNLHHPSPPLPPMQGARGHHLDLHSQVAPSSHRPSTSGTSHTSMNSFQDCAESSSRFVGSVPPVGLRFYRPHRRELMHDASARQRSSHHLRVLPEDGVALLELSDYHEMGDSVDHHRDMRLDIDHMSYEELLALGEQIGSVGSGLSEEFISSNLKQRTFVPSTPGSNLEDLASTDQELNFCVVCQMEYKDQENMGILDCGHEYHSECIKKWLLVKNSCPICKSAALTTKSKEE